MPYKDKEKARAYNKAYGASWYKRNREATIQKSSKRKKEERAKFQQFKAGLACFFCNFSHPAVIEFHHPETSGETKVSKLVQQGSFKRAYAEAEKCIPLCANCHRIYHYQEREGAKEA